MATDAKGIAEMFKLGKVTSHTKGPIIPMMAEDVLRLHPGSYYPLL